MSLGSTLEECDLFYIYQALPMATNPINSIKTALELCTFQGISGNPFEIQAILSLLYHKIEAYYAPISNLQPGDFDLVLHRRSKLRHHLRSTSYEFVITMYCSPQGKTLSSILEHIKLVSSPADACLDWKGEIWINYFTMSQSPPSMVLLHRTPYLCIHGFADNTTTMDAITSLVLDNPNLPVANVLYCWGGPREEAGSCRGLHMVFDTQLLAISIGENLSRLGAF